jgi:inner membrane transporter RhtA
VSVLASEGEWVASEASGGAFGRRVGAVRAAAGSVPPSVLILLGILSVQLGAAVAKNLFAAMPPAGVVALRLLTAAVTLVAVARPRLRGRAWRGSAWRDLAVAGLFGLVIAAMNSAFYQAINHLPLGVAVTVEFLGPLAVAVVGSRRLVDLVWVALAGGGVLMLARGGGAVDLIGIGWALLAAAGWAGYIVLSAATGRRFTGNGGLAMALAVAALLAAPVGIVQAGAALLRPELLLFGVGVGLLSTAIPFVLEMEALRRMPARVFSILMSLEPAVAALIGLAVLGEVLAPRQWLAIGCVIAASVGATRAGRPTPDS